MVKKKVLQIYTYVYMVVLGFPIVGYAQTGFNNPLKSSLDSFSGFTQALLHTAVYILFPLGILAVVYSGFMFVVAQGNEEKITKAKNNFLWTIIGVTLLLGAFALSALIKGTIDPILRP